MTCQIKFAIWSLIFYSIFNSLNVFEHLLRSWLSMSYNLSKNVLHFFEISGKLPTADFSNLIFSYLYTDWLHQAESDMFFFHDKTRRSQLVSPRWPFIWSQAFPMTNKKVCQMNLISYKIKSFCTKQHPSAPTFHLRNTIFATKSSRVTTNDSLYLSDGSTWSIFAGTPC